MGAIDEKPDRVRRRAISSTGYFRVCLATPIVLPLVLLVPPLTPLGLVLGAAIVLGGPPYAALAIPLAMFLSSVTERRQIQLMLAFPIVFAVLFVLFWKYMAHDMGMHTIYVASWSVIVLPLVYGGSYTLLFFLVYFGLRDRRVRPDTEPRAPTREAAFKAVLVFGALIVICSGWKVATHRKVFVTDPDGNTIGYAYVDVIGHTRKGTYRSGHHAGLGRTTLPVFTTRTQESIVVRAEGYEEQRFEAPFEWPLRVELEPR